VDYSLVCSLICHMCFSVPAHRIQQITHHLHHHHHLALQPFVGFRLLRQVSPSSSVLSCFLPVFFILLPSLSWSSYWLVPIGFQSNSFLVGVAWSILWICPSHSILCAVMYLTISAPSINLSISMLFRVFHILSILLISSLVFNNR
jgi:hypothetical protein